MRTDILLNKDTFDLEDLGEEWDEGESDEQHVELLVLLQKGELKEFPFVGFGIETKLNGVINKQKFIRDLKVELESDGYSNPSIIVTDDISDFRIEI